MMRDRSFSLDDFFESLSSSLKNLPKNIMKDTRKAIDSYQKDFTKVYRDSGIETQIDDYINRALIIEIVSIPVIYLLSIGLMSIFLSRSPWWTFDKILLISVATTLIGSSITGYFLVYYPYYKRGEAKNRIEDGLIYFLSYMAVLSASGMPIERILERITEVEDNPPLVHLTKKFLMNVSLFGMNVRTALKDISDISPSKILSKQIEAIRTAISTSGDLKTLLTYEVDRQLQVRRESLKGKLNSLVYLGEIYVVLMVIAPTLFILVITILSVLGGGASGGAVVQLDLLVFLGIPILGGILILLIDQTMGREE